MEDSQNQTTKTPLSNGRRVWLWTAVVISILVLILAVGGVIGSWVARSMAIDVADRVLDSIYQLAEVSREGITSVDQLVGDLRQVTGEVKTAVNEVSTNISDKGLVLTLLPTEREQRLVNTAEQIKTTVTAILDVARSARDLVNAVNAIPFMSVPGLDDAKIESLESDVQEILTTVEQIVADIQAFRDGVAGRIDRVTTAVTQVYNHLATTQQALADADSQLANIQTRSQELKQTVRQVTLLAVILINLSLVWMVYALVNLVRQEWAELHNAA